MSMTYRKARTFLYRNARPLDLARWQYHFEDGSREAVLNALSHYQNQDGGFGHALEADAWNPNSCPIQTWAATEILREIGFTDPAHPIVQGILRYLDSGKDFSGACWYKIVKSNNDYPHAPWWHTQADTTDHDDYNPTASLAGFILRFAPGDSPLHRLGSRIAREAVRQLLAGERENGMHTVAAYVRLLEDLEQSGNAHLLDMPQFKTVLAEQIHSCITQETGAWESEYVCKPSVFFRSAESIFYAVNRSIAEFECDFIVKTQLKDGSWSITWAWDDYPGEWAVSQNWWKSDRIILNLLYLKGFGKLAECMPEEN